MDSHAQQSTILGGTRSQAVSMCQRLLLLAVCGLSHSVGGHGAVVQAQLRIGTEVEPTRLLLRDVSEEPYDVASAVRSFVDRGFALLRPALPNDRFKQEEFKIALRNQDAISAMALLTRHPEGLTAFGFRWIMCSTPLVSSMEPDGSNSKRDAEGRLGAPTASSAKMSFLIEALLLQFPTAGRILKIWMPIKVPVQPLAFAELPGAEAVSTRSKDIGRPETQRWWWAGESQQLGDVVVLDALRSPHTSVSLPGEELLTHSLKAVVSLRESLMVIQNGGTAEVALETCSNLSSKVLIPFPSILVGVRYEVLTPDEYAFVRREESVESGVIGIMYPGSIVTVLAVGSDGGAGRAKIYTEHAMPPMQGSDFVSDAGELIMPERGPMTGWVMSTGFDGKPALRSLAAPPVPGESPPAIVKQRIQGLASVLSGICTWVNATVGPAAALSPPRKSAGFHMAYVLKRHIEDLAAEVDNARRVAFEVQCLALAHPGRSHLLTAAVTAAAVAAAGFRLLR